MKKSVLLIFSLCAALLLHAQVSKTVTVTAGGLAAALTSEEKATITDLTVKGEIDTRDFETIYKISNLMFIDLGEVKIIGDAISERTFTHKLNNIILPSTLKIIGSNALSGTNISSITIPPSVTKIDMYAFNNCNNLKSIDIPNSVTTIGSGAFSFCKNLITASIPNSVIEIDEQIFESCSNLTSVTIPNSISVIQTEMFAECSSLKSINIPKSIKSIKSSAFIGCSSLTSINIPNTVTSIGSSAFVGCDGLLSIKVPDSVQSILVTTFSKCYNLRTLTIPKSVTTIGYGIIANCQKLSVIKNCNKTPQTIDYLGENINFQSCRLYVPIGSKSAYQTTSTWKNFTHILEYNEGDIIISDSVIEYIDTISTKKIAIIADSTWTVTSDQSWLTITPASSDGASEISITAEPNTTGATRTATIIVQIDGQTKSGISKTITVTQAPTTTATAETQATATNLLYPNPASSSISIPTTAAARVFVYNSTGQLVLSKDIAGKEDVNIEALTAGLYKVCVDTAAGVAVYSVVKK